MKQGFELCSGRDHWGRMWRTVLPAGVGQPGRYVRLVGGIFLIVEKVEDYRAAADGMTVCSAAQVLESVWEGRCNV